MTLARQRQLARLEKLAEPHIERIRQAKAHHYAKTAEKVFNSSLVHAANLSLIMLYGKPQIDEPLSKAWQRCCKSTSPELDAIKEIRGNNIFNPFGDRLVGQAIAERFRSFVLPIIQALTNRKNLTKFLRLRRSGLFGLPGQTSRLAVYNSAYRTFPQLRITSDL